MNPDKKTPKKIKPSIKYDTINPSDFLKYDFRCSCEDCSHYQESTQLCTFGYITKYHRKENQLRDYNLRGQMALCRFHEID